MLGEHLLYCSMHLYLCVCVCVRDSSLSVELSFGAGLMLRCARPISRTSLADIGVEDCIPVTYSSGQTFHLKHQLLLPNPHPHEGGFVFLPTGNVAWKKKLSWGIPPITFSNCKHSPFANPLIEIGFGNRYSAKHYFFKWLLAWRKSVWFVFRNLWAATVNKNKKRLLFFSAKQQGWCLQAGKSKVFFSIAWWLEQIVTH